MQGCRWCTLASFSPLGDPALDRSSHQPETWCCRGRFLGRCHRPARTIRAVFDNACVNSSVSATKVHDVFSNHSLLTHGVRLRACACWHGARNTLEPKVNPPSFYLRRFVDRFRRHLSADPLLEFE